MSGEPSDNDDQSAWLDPDAWTRWLEAGADLGLSSWLPDIASLWRAPDIDLPTITDPDALADRRRARSLLDGVRPAAAERLVRQATDRTRWSIVFLHGFGASRAGGEAVVDLVAHDLGANQWYPLLPGHGRDAEAHARAEAAEYLAVAVEALAMGRALGERVLLIGSSTGGLLASWLAARFPDHVDAIILASPFFDYAEPSAAILRLPFGLEALRAALGPMRDAAFGPDPEGRRVDGYERHWLTEQRIDALGHLERLRGWLARPEVWEAVRCPVLLLYAPNDQTADVEAMHVAFGAMASHPASRLAAVRDGHHILMSAWVQTDKASILGAIDAFLDDVDPEARCGSSDAR